MVTGDHSDIHLIFDSLGSSVDVFLEDLTVFDELN
jgi:hypothetical protein